MHACEWRDTSQRTVSFFIINGRIMDNFCLLYGQFVQECASRVDRANLNQHNGSFSLSCEGQVLYFRSVTLLTAFKKNLIFKITRNLSLKLLRNIYFQQGREELGIVDKLINKILKNIIWVVCSQSNIIFKAMKIFLKYSYN